MSKTYLPEPMQKARKLMVELSIMTVIGVTLALIGPFGSFAQPLAYRLVSWLSFAYIGYAIYRPMHWAAAWLHDGLDLPKGGLWVAAVLTATFPMTAAVWAIGCLPGPMVWPSLEQAFAAYCSVLVIGAGVTGLFYMLERRGVPPIPAMAVPPVETNAETNAETCAAPHTRFLDRLPAALGTELIALEMEDHYVRAHTTMGSDLILLRMRDAVAELDSLDGAQIHRSWWAARTAVEGSRNEGRNIRLVLKGGLEAPVSRYIAPHLKKAGWF